MPMKRLASTLRCCAVPLCCAVPYASTFADDASPLAYTSPHSELLKLENGVILEGSDLTSIDRYTSGFRLSAGFSPWQLPHLDLGAELAYRESEEVPVSSSSLIMDTLSLGGALVAGLRLGSFSVYAKSGLTEWRGKSYRPAQELDDGGTALLQGFGATLTFDRLVSRLEYERIDAPTLDHLNTLSASLHLPF
ncbi:hypothetical protein QC815_03805 [Halomonas gomseomensis]|uniref:Outer membrane protein beta-barrel domain-containing protein n=2 Tax=Vreelandella gomseomensis TaxID=370766 RepID=A0ABU1GAF1_9GAMM|nr:hypothetical protein [Halomonas gomseomensis]MDR5874039.1 hypothetical protein [Halomonas gomseomensis]